MHCLACVLTVAAMCLALASVAQPPAGVKLTTIELEVPVAQESEGGLIAADVNDDGAMELLVTAPGYLGVYSPTSGKLWSKECQIRVGGQSESQGLPGHHGPGVQAGDIDGDGQTEVVFLTQDSTVHVVEGRSGAEKWTASPPHPQEAERWEHAVIANFRGEGDRDLLLQATNRKGYRMGRYLAAYSLDDLRAGRLEPLWERDDFLACAHNGARVADLDLDGRDEVIGGCIVSPEGEELYRIPLRGHVDSVFIYNVRPDLPGLEVMALEEGGPAPTKNRVFAYNAGGLIWETHYQNWEPQNAAVGRFKAGTDALQVWCRSRFNEHQQPFVFDESSQLISAYKMDDVAPEGWTASGVEVINCIDWTGDERQLAAAKERHTEGDVCVFDPVSGEFLVRITETASRIYVADVLGDWREEIIVWNASELHIYENTAANPRPDEARLWTQPHYLRSKTTWNYYSP